MNFLWISQPSTFDLYKLTFKKDGHVTHDSHFCGYLRIQGSNWGVINSGRMFEVDIKYKDNIVTILKWAIVYLSVPMATWKSQGRSYLDLGILSWAFFSIIFLEWLVECSEIKRNCSLAFWHIKFWFVSMDSG